MGQSSVDPSKKIHKGERETGRMVWKRQQQDRVMPHAQQGGYPQELAAAVASCMRSAQDQVTQSPARKAPSLTEKPLTTAGCPGEGTLRFLQSHKGNHTL